MRYRLSNRQLKEINNGKVLRIAMPHPPDKVDVSKYFSEHLELPRNFLTEEAEVVYLTINPIGIKGDDGLPCILGQIMHNHQPKFELTLQVECIVGYIHNGQIPRGNYPTQWPREAILDSGRIVPE